MCVRVSVRLCPSLSLQLGGGIPSSAGCTCVAGPRLRVSAFQASVNVGVLYCKPVQCSSAIKYTGGLTVLQIVGTCLALCLSSDLKSLSVVTEVSASGASEVSYFQVSIET